MSRVLYVDHEVGLNKVWRYNISAITRANPCVITANGHKIGVGDRVVVASVGGMAQINGLTLNVIAITANTITVDLDSTAFSTYSSSGTVTVFNKFIQSVSKSNPMVVTCENHDFATGRLVSFNSVVGMTEINNKAYQIQNVTSNTFEININSTGFGTFVSGDLNPVYLSHHFLHTTEMSLVDSSTEVRLKKTSDSFLINLGNLTFTFNSDIVSTSVNYSSSLAVGDYIGVPTAQGNGEAETYYEIVAISANSISLRTKYFLETKTVSGVRKVVPFATGINNSYICRTINGHTVEGGWNILGNVRDGETWYRHAFSDATTANGGFQAFSSGVVRRVNIAQVSFNQVELSGLADRCTIIRANQRGINVFANSSVQNCTISGVLTAATNRPAILVSGNNVLLSNNRFISRSGSTNEAVSIATNISCDLDSNLITCSTVGVSLGVSCQIKNAAVSFCDSSGIAQSASNTFGDAIENCQVSKCNIGILSRVSSGLYVKDCEISQCSTGFNQITGSGNKIENCNFSNNNIDIDIAQQVSNLYSVNNTHISPITRSYSRVGYAGPIYIINCTIDPASQNKAFAVTANDAYFYPQYYIQNSFGFTGQFFGKYEIVKNDLTIPSSVQMKFNIGVNNNLADFKIASTYISTGLTRKLRFKLQALTPGWEGTIIPKIKLNQSLIKTENPITTISTTETQYEYTVSGGLIGQDGELSIEFNANCNTISVLIKDFEVVNG